MVSTGEHALPHAASATTPAPAPTAAAFRTGSTTQP
jgi:hypothetical protein